MSSNVSAKQRIREFIYGKSEETEREKKKRKLLLLLLLVLLLLCCCGTGVGGYLLITRNREPVETARLPEIPTPETPAEPGTPELPKEEPPAPEVPTSSYVRKIAFTDQGLWVADIDGQNKIMISKSLDAQWQNLYIYTFSWTTQHELTFAGCLTSGGCRIYEYNAVTGVTKLIYEIADGLFVRSISKSLNGNYYFVYNRETTAAIVAARISGGQMIELKVWGAGQAREPSFYDATAFFLSPSGNYKILISSESANKADAYGGADFTSGNDCITSFDANDKVLWTHDCSQQQMEYFPVGFLNDDEFITYGYDGRLKKVGVKSFSESAYINLPANSINPVIRGDRAAILYWRNDPSFDLSTPVNHAVVERPAGTAIANLAGYAYPQWVTTEVLIAMKTQPEAGPVGFKGLGISLISIANPSIPDVVELVSHPDISQFYYYEVEPAE